VAAVAGAALMALLKTCAPNVAPATMHAIVTVESGGNPLAIGDNTTHRSYAPRSYQEARQTAETLISQGHSIDLGLAQVNSANFAGYHTTAASVLMPPGCENLIVASAILANAYRWSAATYSDQRQALFGAISAYNTGSLYAGARYVNLVVSAAQQSPIVPSIDILTGQPSTSIQRASAPSAVIRQKPRPKPTPDFAFSTDAPGVK
jgi:type IV secretion system protein VirB1